MRILGIETACDDTAAAVVEAGRCVLSNVVLTQKDVHQAFGGVVPELAARQHSELITHAIERALAEANTDLAAVDAIAVNNQHGLLRSVVVGVAAAKGLALGAAKPLIGVHHVEGHIYSAILTNPSVRVPHVCLAVAGGHNLLIHVKNIGEYEILGRSLDDAAGEAFDKVAKELGLPFPGGPVVDHRARSGDPTRYHFPRPLRNRPELDFSFSGLKTAVRNQIKALAPLAEATIADVAASFQRAVVDVLVHKCLQAAAKVSADQLTVVGGVAANSELRLALTEAAKARSIEVQFAAREYCTDNAAMIAALAYHKQELIGYDINAFPNAPIGRTRAVYKPAPEK